jgi:hypothetical protein
MAKERLKHVAVEKLTHKKLKIYSQLSGIPMHELASKAIDKYIEENPFNEEKQKIFEKWLTQK